MPLDISFLRVKSTAPPVSYNEKIILNTSTFLYCGLNSVKRDTQKDLQCFFPLTSAQGIHVLIVYAVICAWEGKQIMEALIWDNCKGKIQLS